MIVEVDASDRPVAVGNMLRWPWLAEELARWDTAVVARMLGEDVNEDQLAVL